MILEQMDGPWIDELTPEQFPPKYRELVELIGPRNTIQICDRFGGAAPLYIIKLDDFMRKQRDKNIRADRAAGMSYSDLSRRYRLTEVWIRQVCDHQEDNRQRELFD